MSYSETSVLKCYNEEFFGEFNLVLKAEQLEVLTAILNKKSVLAVLPTGYGKSLCFILWPLLFNKLKRITGHAVLVLSPLIALMEQQQQHLEALNIGVLYVKNRSYITQLYDVAYSVILCSPEMACTPEFQDVLTTPRFKDRLCGIAYDEAHCIPKWGNTFRPDYRAAGNLHIITNKPCLMLTATLSYRTRTDLLSAMTLKAEDILQVARIPNRPNIFLHCERAAKDEEHKLKWIAEDIRKNGVNTKKTIIYTSSRASCSNLYLFFRSCLKREMCLNGVSMVGSYHRYASEDTKAFLLEQFCKSDSIVRVMICTIAFGMGVDIPDVEQVIHWGGSTDCLSYWQEVGRCGRDGRDVECHLYVIPQLICKNKHDNIFVDTVYELLDMERVPCNSKNTKITQTSDAATCFGGQSDCSDSDSDNDQPEDVQLKSVSIKKKCLRKAILSQLTLECMPNKEWLSARDDCSQNIDVCSLPSCCTFCKSRCECNLEDEELW